MLTHCFLNIIKTKSSLQIQQIILILPTALSPINHKLMLLLILALILRNRIKQILQLVLRDLLAQLARLRKHDEPVFNIKGARFLDEADAVETVDGFGFEDLANDGRAAFYGAFV